MVVRYLDFGRARISPNETDEIPIVYSNAKLPASISNQSFEPVARRNAEIAQNGCGIELIQLSLGHTPDGIGTGPPRVSSIPAVEDVLGGAVPE